LKKREESISTTGEEESISLLGKVLENQGSSLEWYSQEISQHFFSEGKELCIGEGYIFPCEVSTRRMGELSRHFLERISSAKRRKGTA